MDDQDTYDALFSLYQNGNGSLGIETILDLLNDHGAYNEALRSLYGRVGEQLAEDSGSKLVARIAATLGLEYQKPKCSRCGGTGSIGVISTYRCPEC